MKIYRYILAAALAVSAIACVPTEADLFPESSAQRMNEAVEKYGKALESADNWVMQFYPNHDGQMGGVVFVGSFKNGVASLRCELADPSDVAPSLYQVKAEQECLLTFDSYNPFMHFFSEPQGSSATTGYESDYEFAFKSISADGNTITLKGKRYGQPLVLQKLTTDPEDYLEAIVEVAALFNSMPRMIASVSGEEYEDVVIADGVLSFDNELPAEEGEIPEVETVAVPYVITPEGAHLQTPVTYRGMTFQDMTYNTSDKGIYATGCDLSFPFRLPKGFREYDELVGKYTTTDEAGDVVFNMTVTANGDGVSYTVAGGTEINKNFTVYYNSTFGSFEIRPQYVGLYSTSYHMWIVTVDDESLYWGESSVAVGQNDEDGNVTFGAAGSLPSIMMYVFSSPTASSSTALGYWTAWPMPLVWTRVN